MKLRYKKIIHLFLLSVLFVNLLFLTEATPSLTSLQAASPTINQQVNTVSKVQAQNIIPPSPPFAWGVNNWGQLGDGTTTTRDKAVPIIVPNGILFKAISAGAYHSLALTLEGKIYAWGLNVEGALGDGTFTDRYSPIPISVNSNIIFKAISVGGGYSLALTIDGKVYAWGRNLEGQLGDGTTIDRNTPTLINLPNGAIATAIAAGFTHSIILTNDGKAYTWGQNTDGQLGDGTNITKIFPVPVIMPTGVTFTQIASNYDLNLALTSDGKAYAWGPNQAGQLGIGVQGGTINVPTPVNMPSGVTFTQISADDVHCLALSNDGKVYGWGYNVNGQLINPGLNKPSPELLDLPAGIVFKKVAAGRFTSFFLTREGQVYAYGYNFEGQLGTGTGNNNQVVLPTNIVVRDIDAGFSHTLALTDTDNYSWPKATSLGFSADPINKVATSAIDQFLFDSNHSNWFKFTVTPNSKITINLTGSAGTIGLPANYDLALYKDLQQEYNKLIASPGAAVLSAEAAPPTYLQTEVGPPTYLYDPAAAPPTYLPPTYLNITDLPPTYLPPTYLAKFFPIDRDTPVPPGVTNKQAYYGAVQRGIVKVSIADGLAPELIKTDTWNNASDFYVRVTGRDGAATTNAPFELKVTIEGGDCNNSDLSAYNQAMATLPAFAPPANEVGTYRTIIVTDKERVEGTLNEKSVMLDKLAKLGEGNSEVGTVKVIDLSEVTTPNGATSPKYQRVATAKTYANKNTNLRCPFYQNELAKEIKKVINSYRPILPNTDLTTKYVVLAGPDSAIPFFRYPDQNGLGNENEYIPPVVESGSAQAALRNGLMLGQDEYGSRSEISRPGYAFPIPELAVGRLVENATDITKTIDTFKSGGGLITPQSALVTGYDFTADTAIKVKTQLENGINLQNCNTCFVDAYTDNSWTAQDLRNSLVNKRHDLIFLSGHFDARAIEAANYKSALLSTTFDSSTINHSNSILFGLGCHSGYNIPAADTDTISPNPDWPQVFARKGITVIGGTGYQYGDNELTEYGEKLYLNFVTQLRTGSSSGKVTVSIGQALLKAKQGYLAGVAPLNSLHEKTVLIATLYGLPMLNVRLTGLPSSQDNSVVQPPDPKNLTSIPAGLSTADLTISTVFSSTQVTLKNVADPNNLSQNKVATYYYTNQFSVTDAYSRTTTPPPPGKENGLVANPLEPALPFDLVNVHVNNTTLRGIGFRGGDYNDIPNNFPLTVTPATEIGPARPTFTSPVFFPAQPWGINYLDNLAGGSTRMTLIPAQYKSNSTNIGLDTIGTLRQFSTMNMRLYYSNYTGSAALGASPTISQVVATSSATNINFRVKVNEDSDPTAATTQEVWVTYTSIKPGDPLYGKWQSLNLSLLAGEWQGVLPLGTTSPADFRFMAQAANGIGLVTLDTNSGEYFKITPANPTVIPTKLVLLQGIAPAVNISYLDQPAIKVQLLTSTGITLANKTVSFAIGSQRMRIQTNASGIAAININDVTGNWPKFRILQAPGNYYFTVSYNEEITPGGTTKYLGSSYGTALIVKPRGNQLILSTTTPDKPNNLTGVVATLKDIGTLPIIQEPMSNKTIFFVGTPVGGSPNVTYTISAVTDNTGQARLRVPIWPAGMYNLCAYYNDSTIFAGTLIDNFYQKASNCGSNLTLTLDLTVTSPADSGDPEMQGTLSFALARIGTGKTVEFALTQGSTVNVSGILPKVPSNVTIKGGDCGTRFTPIIIDGKNAPVGTTGLVLSGKDTLMGLKITNFKGSQVKTLGSGNKFICSILTNGS